MSRPIHLLRILHKKHASTCFFSHENVAFQIFWWYDQKKLLFTTFGNTNCPYKSTWNTFKILHKQNMLQGGDIAELMDTVQNTDVIVKRNVFKNGV
jgi:hypothetical protein